ncbi:hypothetical protein AB6A23_23425 [Paenibacillus tarimensis]
MTEVATLTFVPDANGRENQLINVYDDVQYQVIEGFGGALTEASAVTIARMSEEKQREIMDSYFDPERGIGSFPQKSVDVDIHFDTSEA